MHYFPNFETKTADKTYNEEISTQKAFDGTLQEILKDGRSTYC